jgi:hypothetical protein
MHRKNVAVPTGLAEFAPKLSDSPIRVGFALNRTIQQRMRLANDSRMHLPPNRAIVAGRLS